MKIEFRNDDLGTSVNINDDSADKEIMIETTYDGQETWHSFSDLSQLDDFIGSIQVMRDRLAVRIGANTKHTSSR